ncbi:hypothetical protein BBI17_009981 [Phytophthora kernoviae]|uniref:Uncharacterized protein n=1 Tax=Phytophthora kernoviae TaxID=325452 RepID=A0A3R7FXD9_9STRA|nr:hypothetical protein BBI17_009981 [Phytophthora kernoviae]
MATEKGSKESKKSSKEAKTEAAPKPKNQRHFGENYAQKSMVMSADTKWLVLHWSNKAEALVCDVPNRFAR